MADGTGTQFLRGSVLFTYGTTFHITLSLEMTYSSKQRRQMFPFRERERKKNWEMAARVTKKTTKYARNIFWRLHTASLS